MMKESKSTKGMKKMKIKYSTHNGRRASQYRGWNDPIADLTEAGCTAIMSQDICDVSGIAQGAAVSRLTYRNPQGEERMALSICNYGGDDYSYSLVTSVTDSRANLVKALIEAGVYRSIIRNVLNSEESK
jgi:hypothetical protein